LASLPETVEVICAPLTALTVDGTVMVIDLPAASLDVNVTDDGVNTKPLTDDDNVTVTDVKGVTLGVTVTTLLTPGTNGVLPNTTLNEP
jgi:hypothetical protein